VIDVEGAHHVRLVLNGLRGRRDEFAHRHLLNITGMQ
jgi:hypothetical protein